MVGTPDSDSDSLALWNRRGASVNIERRRCIEHVIYSTDGLRACRFVEDWERWGWGDVERDLKGKIVNVRHMRDCSVAEIAELDRLLHTGVIVMRVACVGALSGWALTSID